MILLIHDQNHSMMRYIDHLEKQKISYCDVTLDELINYIQIQDGLLPLKQIIWTSNQQEIYFSNLTGIYLSIDTTLPLHYFRRYALIDREYAREEWLAYLMFRLGDQTQTSLNIINPLSVDICAGVFNLFPYLYHKAHEIGFLTPQYKLLDDREDQRFIYPSFEFLGKKDLCADCCFQGIGVVNSDTVALIEYRKSAPVFVFVIGKLILSTIFYKEGVKRFKLPKEIETLCFRLVLKLNLSVFEICLHRTYNNEYIFHGFSNKLNWNHYSFIQEEIHWALTQALVVKNKRQEKNQRKFVDSFIQQKLRIKKPYDFLN